MPLSNSVQILSAASSAGDSGFNNAFPIIVAVLIIAIIAIVICAFIVITLQSRKFKDLLSKGEKIGEKQENLERTITMAPIACALCVNGIVTDANETAKNVIGLNVGDKLSSVCEDEKYIAEVYEKAKEKGVVSNELVRVRFKDGQFHRCLLNFELTKYEGENTVVFWAIDIEQQEAKKDELQDAHQNLMNILDVLPVSIRVIEAETKEIIYINNMCIKMFKYDSFKEVVGRNVLESLPEIQSNGRSSKELLDSILSGSEPDVLNVEYKANDGTIIYTNAVYCKITYNGKNACLVVIQDLAAEREYEARLMNAAEKEKEANQLKSRFLVNMSHEIRTPMNAIIGLTEIELQKELDKDVKQVYKKINISAKNLLEIVNDVLDLSKLEADKVGLIDVEFELAEVLNSALLVASPRLEGKNLEFMLNAALDLPRYVIGDKTKLWQILKNFIDNSAKYTDKGKITLTVFTDNMRSDNETVTITFAVEDTGVGIAEEQMEKLFMPYEQIHDDAQKKYSGTGLGMPISKRLCEIMGGTLKIESNVGLGTTIHMSIPFKRSANTETAIQASQSSMLRGMEVLVVDDDELSRDIMSRLLAGCEANCILAKSGKDAMGIILDWRDKGKTFDIILLDYMMDGLNGLETAKQIHAALSKAPKLLMVTAHQKLLLKSELKENAIEDIIEKPFVPTQFISKICAIIGENTTGNAETVFMQFKGANVLLCEDNGLNQEVAAGMFEQFGIVPVIASNGKEGVEILNAGKAFDLVFMDLQMPVMDGYEAAKTIRADSRFNSVPIIALTADAMNEVVEKCIESGMNGHITKPIEFESLTQIFGEWLPKSKRVNANAENEPAPLKASSAPSQTQVSSKAGEPPSDTSNANPPQTFAPPSKVLARFGGKVALYEKAMKSFAQMLPDEWQDFDGALQDEEELAREVHKLKGTAGNLGEDAIYQYAVDFETSLRAHAPDKNLYDKLVDACFSTKYRIMGKPTAGSQAQQSENPDEPPKNMGTAEEFSTLTSRLRTALENYDPADSSEILDLLKAKNWAAADKPNLQKLYELTDNYEFEDALDALKLIVEKI